MPLFIKIYISLLFGKTYNPMFTSYLESINRLLVHFPALLLMSMVFSFFSVPLCEFQLMSIVAQHIQRSVYVFFFSPPHNCST